jgi:glycine oxidase
MPKVVIIGGGVVGTAIAYALSQNKTVDVTVLEAQSQMGQGATKSALGVMMGACSSSKNAALTTLRLASLQLYETLVPELEAKTGIKIPYNRHGILLLANDPEMKLKWQALIDIRAEQGYEMKLLDQISLRSQYPQLQADFGLFSYGDRAINPSYLVQALVAGAKLNGVEFIENHPVQAVNELQQYDWVVIAAGLGSNPLSNSLSNPLIDNAFDSNSANPDLHNSHPKKSDILTSVGGQAIQVYLPSPPLKPVIHAEDLNIISVGLDRYWIGATVEFATAANPSDLPNDQNINLLLQKAIKFYPEFAHAKILSTWAGDRPRPKYQGSPIIGFMPNQAQTLIATGHYRNGVLMAPVTAQIIKDLILQGHSDLPWQKQQLRF